MTEKQSLLPPHEEQIAEHKQEQEQQPSLHTLRQNVRNAQQAYLRAWSRTTSGKGHQAFIAIITIFLALVTIFGIAIITEDYLSDDDGDSASGTKVPLEAHIMSKCPDAKDCLHDLILPTMQRVEDLVDFRLSYIGSTTPDDDGVACKHGPAECLGNIIELCAAHLYPDPKIFLGFTMCLTREYAKIPERDLVEDCALEHGIDMYKVNKCAASDEGSLAHDMLKASFNRSAEAGVTKSCTVRLNDDIRCIRDDGEWTDCEGGHRVKDLVGDIKELAKASSH